ncbi:MAG TPA: PAS-domain containing protein, partial [Burkholderiaceae bacterium]|nr:PAS-domain containing protein [Burkholderiaceae bacterium]
MQAGQHPQSGSFSHRQLLSRELKLIAWVLAMLSAGSWAATVVVLLWPQLLGIGPDAVGTWLGAGQRLGAVTAVALIAVLALALWRGQKAWDRLRGSAELIEDAFSSLTAGLAIWDEADRLVAFNQAFLNLYDPLRPSIRVGARYEDLVRAYFRVAPKEVIAGRSLEQFVSESVRRHRDGLGIEVVRNHGGRWMKLSDARMPQGGIVSLRVDVTEEHLREIEGRKQRKVMDDLAEMTYDWFWRTDASGRFVEFNGLVEASFRMPASNLLGKRREELLGFEADEQDLAHYRACIDARRPFPWLCFRTLRGDGSPLWVAVTGRPLLDDKGGLLGYYGVGRDVSERESTFAALRQSEGRFRALTALATDWFWETDADLRITLVKAPEHNALDLEKRLVGKTIAMLANRPQFSVDWARLHKLLETRQAFRRVPYRVHDDA